MSAIKVVYNQSGEAYWINSWKANLYRCVQLSGLPQAEAQEILKAQGLVSTEDESRILIEYYAGNPWL